MLLLFAHPWCLAAGIQSWQETLETAQRWGLAASPLEKQNEEPGEEFWAQTSLFESEVAIF